MKSVEKFQTNNIQSYQLFLYIVLIKKHLQISQIQVYGKSTKFLVIILESPALLPSRKPLINTWCEMCNV